MEKAWEGRKTGETENDQKERKNLLWIADLGTKTVEHKEIRPRPKQELMFYFTLSPLCFAELLLRQTDPVGGYPV